MKACTYPLSPFHMQIIIDAIDKVATSFSLLFSLYRKNVPTPLLPPPPTTPPPHSVSVYRFPLPAGVHWYRCSVPCSLCSLFLSSRLLSFTLSIWTHGLQVNNIFITTVTAMADDMLLNLTQGLNEQSTVMNVDADPKPQQDVRANGADGANRPEDSRSRMSTSTRPTV